MPENAPTIIAPTIGRDCYFKPNELDIETNDLTLIDESPLQAKVVFVHPDGEINIGGYDHSGNTYRFENIKLVQQGEEPPEGESFAHWMQWQIEQAAKPQQ